MDFNGSYYEVTQIFDDLVMESTTQNDTFFHDDLISKSKITLGLYNILVPSIGALAIVLNLTVVVSSGLILKKGQQPKTTYLFLGNVALTDFVTCISVVFGQIFPNKLRNHASCAFQMGMIVSSTLTSIYSVALIAIDRYLYLIHGLMYQKWMYPSRARILIRLSWLLGCIIGYLPLMGWHGDTNDGEKCLFLFLLPKYLILLTIIAGIIPLLTVITLYLIILTHAIKNIFRLKKAESENATEITGNGLRIFRGKSSNLPEQDDENLGWFKKIIWKKPSNKVKGPNKWKAVKVVIFTSGSFLSTWGPYFTTAMVYLFTEDRKIAAQLEILIASPLAILGFANSLINPIIYAWWHKGFRHFVLRSWSAARKRQSVQSISKTTSSTQAFKTHSNLTQNLSMNHFNVYI